MIGWADIPHRALIADHGSVLSDEVLLRLFCDALSIKQEQQQSLIETIIVRFGSLAAVFSANDRALSGLVHIGLPMRVALRIIHEAAIRVSRARLDHENIFNNRKFMFDYLISRLAREPIEQFRILFLDEKNRLLADETQSRGTVNHTPVYPREVARRAMELGAKSVILVHNHPSGDPTPSRDDIVMTHDMQKAMGLIAV
ncbi:JAB domain-containing protein, partial [Asaia prunellae]|uniref:JAB domain-containing protein n=1 Tax=Asaia prunellae TaxID=610245 RepID=UPI000471F4B3